MKLLVPKTLIGAFSPTLLISWLFGIGVVEYPMGRPRPIISAVSSIVNFLVYLGLLRMTNYPEIKIFHKSELAANNYRMLQTYFFGTFVATSICLAHIRAKVFRESRHKLNVMNDGLKTLGIPNDYEVVFKAQIIHISFVSAHTILMMVLNFEYVGFDLPSDLSRIGFVLLSHYLLAFALIADSNFYTCVRYFRNRFQRLNQLLAGFESAEKNKTTATRESDNQFERCSSAINRIHQNSSLAIRVAENQWLLYVIRETRKIHLGLCKTVMESNRAFGVQVLLSVALSFGMITALLYTSYIILTISAPNSPPLKMWMLKIVILMWISSYGMKIIRIVDACETTSSEANRTREIISKLLDTVPAGDEDIRDEINIFSLQLIQNPLNFTASGFFTLDYSLVRGIIGSVTTYLVIMIQMRGIYESGNIISTPDTTMLMRVNSTD